MLYGVGEEGGSDDGDQTSPDETLDCLLGTEDNEGSGAKEEAAHVGRDVVDGDDGHAEDVPDHAVAEGQVHEVARPGDVEGGHVSPGQQTVAAQTLGGGADGEDEPGHQADIGQETQPQPLPSAQGQPASHSGVEIVKIPCNSQPTLS